MHNNIYTAFTSKKSKSLTTLGTIQKLENHYLGDGERFLHKICFFFTFALNIWYVRSKVSQLISLTIEASLLGR